MREPLLNACSSKNPNFAAVINPSQRVQISHQAHPFYQKPGSSSSLYLRLDQANVQIANRKLRIEK